MYHRSVLYGFSGAFTVMLNTAVDGMIISHFLGNRAMTAFGLILPLYSLMSLFPVLLRTASQLNLGTDLGRGNLESARQRVFQLLCTGLAAAVPLLLVLTVSRSAVVSLLSAFDLHAVDTISMAEEYLLWFAPAMLPLMLCPVLHPIMQLDGDMRRSPRAIHIATIVNIAGDLLNALVLHFGMAGMAAASTLSCYGELLVLLLHYRGGKAELQPHISREWQGGWVNAVGKGIPSMLRELCAFLTGIAMNLLAFRIGGEDTVAALAAANSGWLFMLPAAMAVSGAGMSLGSIAFGEADDSSLYTVLRLGLWYAIFPCVLYAMVFLTLSPLFAAFCAGENHLLVPMIQSLLRSFSLALPAVVACQVIEGYLNVTEEKLLSALVNCLDGGLVWLLAAWLLGQYTAAGIGLGRLAGELVLALSLMVGFFLCHSGKSVKENACQNAPEPAVLETTVYTADEVTAFSENLSRFCEERGIARRICFLSALCTEELACNTLRWGYGNGIDCGVDIRAVCRNGEIVLRFRDAGQRFNPKGYISQVLAYHDQPDKNVGLKIISGIAAEMQYMCVADCNVLLIRVG